MFLEFFDTRTLYGIIGLFNCFMPIIVWVTVSTDRSRQVSFWCLGGGGFGLGLILIALRGLIPDWISFPIASFCLVSGKVLQIQALRFDIQKTLRLLPVVTLLGVFLVVFEYLRLILKAPELRIQWVFLMLALMSFNLAYTAWQSNIQKPSKSVRRIAFVEGFVATAIVVRLIELSSGITSADLFVNDASVFRFALMSFLTSTINHVSYLGVSLERSFKNQINLVRDLTQKKERTLNQARLEMVLDSLDGYIYTKDRAYRYTYANHKVCEFLGLPLADILGRQDSDFLEAKSALTVLVHEQRLFDQGQRVQVEEMISLVNSRKSVEFYSIKTPLRSPEGEVYGLCCVSTDITERKQIEAKLYESEVQYRTLADSGPAMIRNIDAENRCDFVNKAWLTFTGRTLREVMGAGWMRDVHPDDLNRYVSLFQSSFQKHEDFNLAFRLRNCEGEYRWIEEHSCPRFDAHEQFIGYTGFCMDVSVRKMLEDTVQQGKTLFLEQIAQMDRQRSLGQMSASLAHELNQPLTAVLTNAEVVKRGVATGKIQGDQIQEFVDRIMFNTRRASQIIERIRGFIRPQSMKKTPLDLDRLARDTIDLITSEALRYQVAINFLSPKQAIWVEGDPIQLSQVLLNIYRNAIEVLRAVDKREINIKIDLDDQHVILSISDTGPGISDEALHNMGMPFFTTKSDGLGMGLSISRNILEHHSGQLIFGNNEGLGANFKILLPVVSVGLF